QGLFAGIFGRGGVDTGDEAWLQALLDTEAALARALERAGLAEPGAGATVTAAAQAEAFDAAELGRQAALTGNPVPAVVRELTGMVPPDAAGAVHKGATSQDIIDTAAMLLARQALSAIAADLSASASAAAVLAATHRDTLMIGRTLLQQAVPVTFGLVAAGWLTSLDDAREAVARVPVGRLAVQLGGAAMASGWPACSPTNSGWPGRCCPGTPTGCGCSTSPPQRPGRPRCSARPPGTSPCSPSPRWPRSARGTAPAQAFAARAAKGVPGAARPRCRTSATRAARSPCSAARARCRDSSPPSPPPPSRSISAPPVPGTRSGSRSATCSG